MSPRGEPVFFVICWFNTSLMPWFDRWLSILNLIALRYFIVAGVAFLICYVLLRRHIFNKKIQLRFPKRKDYAREISFSCVTIVIFALVPTVILRRPVVEYTMYYRNISDYSIVWFVLAFPLMFFLHDAYFYWTHRFMHWKRVFPWFHKIHHLSTNPSPWAAFAFHPLEAIVEIGIFPIVVFIMPLTYAHLITFFVAQMLYNVYGHLGWELYPRWFARHQFGKWINTSVNHNQHHQFFKGNYGLYFLWWDRWMGTIRKDYEERFEEIAARAVEPEHI